MSGQIKLPIEIVEEVLAGGKTEDPQLDGMRLRKDALRLREEADPALVNRVVTEGYALDLTDAELVEVGRDPFLIAYALARPEERCVVTVEVSRPGKKRQNRRIPDVCGELGVRCLDPFQAYRDWGFSTGWKRA